MTALQLEGRPPIGSAGRPEEPALQDAGARITKNGRGEIHHDRLAEWIHQHVPVMKIPLGYARRVDDRKKGQQAIEKDGGNLAPAKLGEIKTFYKSQGEGE